MKADIEIPQIENIHVAAVNEKNDDGELVWNIYLINLRNDPLEKVLVSSTGYKVSSDGERSKSSTLRHLFDVVPAQSAQKIEPIIEDVFHLNNEYFVSCFGEKGMHERKFIFLPETITKKNFTKIPVLEKDGVLI